MVLTLEPFSSATSVRAGNRSGFNISSLQAPRRRAQQLHRVVQKCKAAAEASVQAGQAAAKPTAAAAAAAATVPAPAAPAPSSSAAALTYTSYEGNSFYVQFKSGINVLVDPWLVGKLTFGGLEFVYAGSKRVARPEAVDLEALAAATDVLVLTQGIDDHAHRPTLQRLPKTVPVVASASGAAVARSLGFRTVYTLGTDQSLTLGGLTLQGTAGALVGPPWSQRELGVVLRDDAEGGASLYYEPHADYLPESVRRAVAKGGPVDVVVSPPCSQSLLGYPLVKGATDSLDLLRLLRPKVFVPLMNAEIDQAGPLAELLVEEGSVEELQRQLAAQPDLAAVRVALPTPAQPMAVVL
ncbi:hypothetical protein CHLNCDRAFT_139469 [Chlorella variabilis]|uniref:Metallo-beta-lactamase domain-containing protein n=1 Tax=Chlorella variabilis TaxID=554065 RepID=E1ZQ78_CHLVA|nr:hypothetical protein CHLNCDRAFT_139469 [Chlorella variabilis]EFN51973.1 hypothetical protein CHLNCDRAFT_139469 [Chlorella variabilis]|eukprot:XP_005844075.1 hypothetical protein CHLNCDRAFT_139469 [Chlorella variabilis]